jgi:hypothetical protein
VALEAAVLFGFAYATDSHVLPANLLADKSVFIDGTKSITGNEEGVPFFRMADAFQGRYAQPEDDDNLFVKYPRSLGPATGLGDPTYDVSEGLATDEVVALVRQAKTSDYTAGVDTIYVVGYSQGAGGAVSAIPELETDEFADDNIEFVLAANPRRNDGGLLARLPKGVYLPIFGVTFGGGTTPEDKKVLQVTKQYDLVGDAPKYLFNVVADANALLGFYYLHPGYYKTVDPTPDPTDPSKIVTTSADGKVTDVLIKAPVGELPLTIPLRQLGVPENVVIALDPFLRSIIETAYERPDASVAGSYPSEPVPFQLVPPPTRWLSDIQSVAAGAAQTTQQLAGVAQPGGTLRRADTSAANQRKVTPVEGGLPADVPPTPAEPDADAGSDPRPADKPATGTGPNKTEPPQKPKAGWQPGDLLRSFLTPKPVTAAPSTPGGGAQPASPTEPSNPTSDPVGTSSAPAGSTPAA